MARSFTKNCTTFSLLRFVRKFSRPYHSAGVFKYCRHAFFDNDSEFSVYQSGDLRTETTSPSFSRILTQQYKHGEFIRNVASFRAFIIVVTSERVIVFRIDLEAPIEIMLHDDWDPSGLAWHESETHLVILLGQCQRHKNQTFNGQIRIYRYRIDGQFEKLPVFSLNVPENDWPTWLSSDTDSQIFTCITRIQNKLLVWKVDGELVSPPEPFEFLDNKYTALSAQSLTAPAGRNWHQLHRRRGRRA